MVLRCIAVIYDPPPRANFFWGAYLRLRIFRAQLLRVRSIYVHVCFITIPSTVIARAQYIRTRVFYNLFLKEQFIKADRSLQLCEAKNHPSQSIVAEFASNIGWLKIWDTALDREI